MNSSSYSLGALALALVISGLPTMVLANESTSTLEASGGANVQMQNRTRFEFEDSTTSVRSLIELQSKIEQNRQDLDQDEASTTPEDKDMVKRTNPVRLAVHALLDSKDLLGGIGPQVSEIAKEMNDSLATTTESERRIQSRGFFTRFLFGGDKNAAEIISQIVARNQQLIASLTTLLSQATISADMRTTLNAQITALEDAQIRLQDLALREQHSWGVFSWRFGK